MFNESNIPNYTNPSNIPNDRQIMSHSFSSDCSTEGNSNCHSNKMKQNGSASNISTSFNIIKGLMGVALLTIPWSMANTGLIPSLILLLISFILSYISWIFLCLLCAKYNVYSYRDIGLIIFGLKFAILLDLILLIFLYLVCILYVVFLSEFIIDALSSFNIDIDINITFTNLYLITTFTQFIKTKFFIITATIFCILFPLSLLKRLDSLKYSSFLGIIGCFYIIGLIVFTFFDEKYKNGYYISTSVQLINYHQYKNESDKFFWFWLSSFNIFVAAFNTHFNAPALYGELKNKTTTKFINISTLSFVIVFILNLIIALCGYFAFGVDTEQNILNGLSKQGMVVTAAQLIMTLTIIGTYPLLFWNIKVSIDNLILYKNVTNQNHTKVKKVPRKYTCLCSKIFLYFIVTVTIWVISIVAFDVAIILAFLEALLGNAIVFIFPSVFYLQMLKKDQNTNTIKLFLATLVCYIVVLFGILCVIGGCTASIMFWTHYIS